MSKKHEYNVRKAQANGRYKHGWNGTKEHGTWLRMKARCYNPKRAGYALYGGRGIKVCGRWLYSFENFLADMGPAPTPEHSIDRIDVNKGYSKRNCRWATRSQQCRNQRTNRRFTYQGETKCLGEWAELFGMNYGTLQSRIYRDGMSIEDALTKPMRYATPKKTPVSNKKYQELLAQAAALAGALDEADKQLSNEGDCLTCDFDGYINKTHHADCITQFIKTVIAESRAWLEKERGR